MMKCQSCEREIEVGEEAKSCMCSYCLMNGLSLEDIKVARKNKKVVLASEKAAKKAKNKAKTSSATTVDSGDQSKKKRGRPRKNPLPIQETK